MKAFEPGAGTSIADCVVRRCKVDLDIRKWLVRGRAGFVYEHAGELVGTLVKRFNVMKALLSSIG